MDSAEDRFAHMGALGSDIDTVKKQIEQLKDFKAEVDPHMVKVEALNRYVKFENIMFVCMYYFIMNATWVMRISF